jgi:DNA-binding transcriptional LysR family regulator
LLPSSYCDDACAAGRLVRLLPKWTSPEIPVFAVYPSRKFLPSRLQVFLEALTAWQSPMWLKV